MQNVELEVSSIPFYMRQRKLYLHQGGYVFAGVYLFVCVFVSTII